MNDITFDYRVGHRIAPDAAPSDFLAKAPYVDNGTDPVPPEGYYSRDYMKLEWEKVWKKSWIMAGVLADVREPGDYFKFDVGPESFIIVRGKDDKVRAFYNVCIHRGLRMVDAAYGSFNERMTCPFHTWSYRLDGGLEFVTDRETFRPEVLCHAKGLKEVACEVALGFVFISMNENPPPLSEHLNIAGEHLAAYKSEDMIVARHTRVVMPANWKAGIDGFIEPYHFHAIHQQVLPIVDDYNIQIDLYPKGVSRMLIPQLQPSPRLDDPEALNEGMQISMLDSGMDVEKFKGDVRAARQEAQLARRARAAELGLDYSGFTDPQLTDSITYAVFPNVVFGCHPEAIMVSIMMPHPTDPEIHYYDTITLYQRAQREDGSYVIPRWMAIDENSDLSGEIRPEIEMFTPDNIENLGELYAQDVVMIVKIAQGIKSQSFKGALLGEQEQRVRHFHAEIARYMADAG